MGKMIAERENLNNDEEKEDNMKRILCVLTTMLLAAACFADGAGMAPINPEFLKWKARKERREVEKAAQTNEVSRRLLTTMSQSSVNADEDELDYGFVPEIADMSYLANINSGVQRAIRQEGYASSYDPRSSGRLTSVKDQGAYGTCWAHATMGSLESWLRISENQTFNFSENNLANLHGFDWGFDDGGNASLSSAYLLRWAGPVLETQDAYPNPGKSTALSPARHVQRVRWIAGKGSSLDNDDIKDAILKYGALYVSYFHSSSYYNSSYKSYYHPSATRGNHAVAVVGWDDNYSKDKFSTKPSGNGAYIVRNSWGTSWGDGGYFYVSYYDSQFARSTMYAFCSAEETSNYSRVYQYDTYGFVTAYRAANSTTAYGAAIFTANAAESIGAVGFYALVPNTSYTISIRTGVSSGNPSSGTLAATQSGSVDDAGFVTIPLDTAVSVTSGSRFAVILKVTTPGYSYPLATEILYSGYCSAATASSGQTYISADGSSWKDFTSVNSSASFCLKAYAKTVSVKKTLTAINCYSSDNSTKVAAGKTKQFTCKATYSDGSEKTVSPTWSITSGGSYGSISSSGLFTAASVTSEKSVGVKASYIEGGITKTSSFTVTITVAAPNVPTGLTATAGTESSCVRLAWTAVDGATGYSVYRATGSGASSASAKSVGRVDQSKYADTDATPGVDYTYFVKAKNGSGTSAFSSGASGWRALSAPSNVAATDGTSTDWVKIGWGEVSGAAVYRVYRGTSEVNMTALSGWITDLAYTDTTATPGTLYYYAVKAALDSSGTRASELSIVDTGVREKANVPESMTISGPSTLASGAQGSYTANIRRSNGGSATCVPTWTCEGKSSTVSPFVYTAPVVSASKTVTLSAKATVEGVALTATRTITVSPSITAAPSAPTITATTTSGISLSWTSVSGASSYVVYRGTTTASSSATKIGTATGTTFTDTSVTPGQTVYYFLAAVNAAGTSALSAASSSAVRTLAAPTGVTASNGMYTDKVRVTWGAVSGASYYRVSRATSSTGSQTDLGSWQTGTTYDDTSATAGTTYYYFVRAATSSSGANVSAKSSPGAKGLRKVEVTLSALAISGADRVNAGVTAVYAAKANYSDGTTKTVSPTWSITTGTAATIDAAGKLTAASVTSDASVTFTASYTEGGKTVSATKTVTIIAPIPKTVTVSNVKATSRWPWKSIIDIDYTLTVTPSDTKADISVEVTDKDRLQTFLAQTLTGDTEDLAAGAHRVSWDLGVDKPEFATSALDIDIKARVRTVQQPKSTYLAIDLSGGVDAASYPIEELDAVPSGSWSDEYKTTKLVLRRIEPGTFTMGGHSTDYPEASDLNLHQVTLTKAFYMGVFEVTQRQWELVMGTKPSYFTNATCYAARPVEQVSYNMIRGSSSAAVWPNSSYVDATSFLGVLRQKSGLTLDLPTEAQWEYACRAGTTTAINSGKNLTSSNQDSAMDKVGRYWYNSGSSYSQSCNWSACTAKVGSYAPNVWGLYDMHGNVCELCLDWYASSLSAAIDPVGAASGVNRVMRGGSWYNDAGYCRSAYRGSYSPLYTDNHNGFRLCVPTEPGNATMIVAFDANGGLTAVSSQTYAKDGKYTSLPAATRDGYVFAGWYTAASGGTKVTSETTVSASISMLYARWTAQSLSAPTNVSASDGTSTSGTTISWSSVTGATMYYIYRYTSNSSSSASLIGTSTSTSYTDTTGTAGTTYYYWVKAYNSAGYSSFSACDTGYQKTATITVPSAPTLSCSNRQDGIRLSWTAVSGATSYKVYLYQKFVRTSGTQEYHTLLETTTSTTYDCKTLGGVAIDTTTHYFRVTAVNSAGESGYSNVSSGHRQY